MEGLAIVWSMSKFHKYVFGRRFTLYTDHRPLLFIFGSKKGVPTHVANRIQRWAIILMAYDFDLQFTRTEEFGHADILSRLIADHRSAAEDELVIAEVRYNCMFVLTINAALPVTFEEIVQATADDQVFPIVMDFVINGWPVSQNQIQCRPAIAFHRIRESLSSMELSSTWTGQTSHLSSSSE